jgi:uncharacterized membrane protein
MNIGTLSSVILLISIFTPSSQAQQYIDLPTSSWANDVTPDGSIVVGTWEAWDGFIWNWREDPAPTPVLGGNMVAVSDDGTVVAGNFFDASVGATVAGVWTQATGWQSLGLLPGGTCGTEYPAAYDISGDGTVIVGLGWGGCDSKAFRWTAATGMVALEHLANGVNRCSAISGDGSAMGGFAQGSFSRTPAYWESSTAGDVLNEDDEGEVFGFNEDGSTSVGTYRTDGNLYDAFVRDQVSGVMTILGTVHSNWSAQATDISEDGNTIVGFDHNGLAREAWVWTSTDGMISLNDRLTALGVTGVGPLYVCRAISDDGTVIVGGGEDGGLFGIGGFILDLSDDPWTDLGGGTVGINGQPQLSGSGTLVGGSTATLVLTDAPASTPMLAWMSFASTPQNHFGGTVHATPFSNQFLLGSSSFGTLELSTTWPVGVPADTEVWFQFILSDPSVIPGLTLSNGLKATTP